MPPSRHLTPLTRLGQPPRGGSGVPKLPVTPEPDLELYAIPEVARRLSLSRDSVYDLIRAGSLRAVTVKAKFRVRPSDLAAYISRLS